jgi:hypothetical protein
MVGTGILAQLVARLISPLSLSSSLDSLYIAYRYTLDNLHQFNPKILTAYTVYVLGSYIGVN